MKRLFEFLTRQAIGFLMILASILVIAAFFLPSAQLVPAYAGSGYTAEVVGVNNTSEDGYVQYFKASPGDYWGSFLTASAGTTAVDQDIYVQINYPSYPGTGFFGILARGQLCFDTSSLPDDAYIGEVTLRLWAKAKSLTGAWPVRPWVVITPGSQQVGAPVVGDFALHSDILLADPVNVDDIDPLSYVYFEFRQAGLDYINLQGITKFKVRDLIWDVLCNDPSKVNDKGSIATCQFASLEAAAGAERPRLFITYGDTPYDRKTTQNPENAAPGGGGNDVTAIEWKTVRCAYADEELGFRVNGAAGTPLQLRLVKEDGTIIDQVNDAIRSDGYFYWRAGCGLGDRGFVRCTDLLHPTKFSEWGYIAAKPDASQIHNYTYANHTCYTQYDKPFADYMVGEAGLQIIHWRTDVQCKPGDDEMDEYSFRLYHLGDPGDMIYNQKFSWLLDNYYKNVYTGVNGNDRQAGIRYILFVFDAPDGFNTHDGLVLDIDRPYISANTGFYQPLIYQDGEAEYSTTHSAYCYIKNSVGIEYKANKSDYNAGDPIILSCTVAEATGAFAMWDKYKVDNLKGGLVLETIEGALTTSVFEISGLTAGSVIADYILRVTLFDSSEDVTYSYVHDVKYTVGGGKKAEPEEDLIGWLEGLLEGWGLGGAVGKWLMILAGMAVAYIIAHKNRLMRVILPLMVFGFGIVSAWLDIWVVVLLALGAGVMLWFLLRRGLGHGGGEGEG